jgi:hypothetical protein
VYCWDAAGAKPLGPPLPQGSAAAHLEFRADGRALLTATADQVVRVWALPPPWEGDAAQTRLRLEVLTGAARDAGDHLRPLDLTAWRERRARLAPEPP